MKLSKLTRTRIERIKQIIASPQKMDRSVLKSIYEQTDIYFSENLEFLESTSTITYVNNYLILTSNPTTIDQLIFLALRMNNDHFRKLNSFIRLFDDLGRFIPTESEIVNYYEERMFLLNFGYAKIVLNSIVLEDGFYKENLKSIHLTQDDIDLANLRKKALGKRAELIALEYELMCSEEYIDIVDKSNIKRISEEWANAGYDILGFDRISAQNGVYEKILIEVKAVDINKMEFHWSQNEINIAKLNQDIYYIYLVDVERSEDNLKESIKVIHNPYIEIFGLKSLWTKQCESVIVSMEVKYGKQI
ncbi:MAG: hypothetical protein FD133_1660 [Erysipelotrichaceae bacterium]|nr:MAG: hypothetical protein FD133_1660 [Erysipelotrichaceae bacterium]